MFVLTELFDNGDYNSHMFNARDMAIYLCYFKPGKKLSSLKKRNITHNFTVVDAIVNVERI